MGATTFFTRSRGKTAEQVFYRAQEWARHEYGHGGYTGTIAEKDGFRTIDVPKGVDPADYAFNLIEECDPRIDDKWGPAGCIDLGEDDGERLFMFFGWASE